MARVKEPLLGSKTDNSNVELTQPLVVAAAAAAAATELNVPSWLGQRCLA